MLPEKKKKLIVGCISILVIIITVFAIAKLSNYIKNKNDENTTKERRNNDYPSEYKYFGILQDEDGIYKIYGISNSDETYLEVRTFYKIQDIINKDNKLVLYSDATNELRYDNKAQEFYFYELDSSYSNKEDIRLNKNYIIMKDEKKISYKKYDELDISIIDEDVLNKEYIVKDNKVYFVKSDGIHEYNLDTKEDICIINITDEITLLNVTNGYVIINKENDLIAYKIDGAVRININDYIKEPYEFLNITESGILIKQDNKLKEFSFVINKVLKNQFDLKDYTNTLNIYLGNGLYYLNLKEDNNEKYVIIDFEEGKEIKEFNNKYLYIWRVVQ